MQRNKKAEPIEPVVKVNRNKTNPKRGESRDYHRERNLSLSLSLKETNWYEQVDAVYPAFVEIENRRGEEKTRLSHLGEKGIAVFFPDLGRGRLEFAPRNLENIQRTVTHSHVQRGGRGGMSRLEERRGGKRREKGWPNWMEGD